MTKSDLIRIVSVKNEIPIETTDRAVDAFFQVLAEGMKGGHRIELRGFGSFQVRDYDGYMGRNPKTGETVPIAPKRMPFFKAGKETRTALNDGAAK